MFGNCWLACQLWQQLGLEEFWQERLPESHERVSWEKVLRLLVVNRLLAPGSEFRLHRQWFLSSAMDELLSEDFAVAEKDRLYRCLDRVLEHRAELFVWLKQKWSDLFQADLEVLLYDLTSTYFEGEMESNGKAKRGYSRDGRPDCLQVVIALVITPDGLPLAYEVMDGNTSDRATLKPFLEKIDPAIKHKLIPATDISQLTDPQGTGNVNPDRKWCSGRNPLICIESTYKLEGKIPIGITLVNKLRDSKKVADHIDFQSELAARLPADLDQSGLQELTALNTSVAGVLEQNIFYVNQIMKFGKFFAVFQAHPSDADKTVVTAFMALAIKASVLDEKRDFEKVPVLRNLVPAQVLMGQSSFNSGDSISAGLPKYARNEIKTVAGLLQAN